jgi:hypothetical protein
MLVVNLQTDRYMFCVIRRRRNNQGFLIYLKSAWMLVYCLGWRESITMQLNTLYISVHSQNSVYKKNIINSTVTLITLQYTLKYFTLHEAMKSAVKTTLLKGWGWRDELVRGEALCRGKQVFCVTETATVTETSFLKIVGNKTRHTHTHTSGRTPLTSYQPVAWPLLTQHTTNTTEEHPCDHLDSNLSLQKSSSHNLHIRLHGHRDRPVHIYVTSNFS